MRIEQRLRHGQKSNVELAVHLGLSAIISILRGVRSSENGIETR